MIRARITVAPFVVALVLAGAACRTQPPAAGATPVMSRPVVARERLAVFAPLPASVASESGDAGPDAVVLGRMLFYEPRLSRSQTISCNSCHDLARYGVDGQPTSDGFKGQRGTRNAPTVFNAAGHFVQFWDGRAPDVEAQAKGPMLNPVEMAMPDADRAIAVVKSMPEYVALFTRAFPDEKQPVTFDNMAKAIGAFERKLMTPSRWDALFNGDTSALTSAETVGLRTFLDTGCQVCHNGALLGGTTYQKLGQVKPYPGLKDPGRYDVTKVQADFGMFKVPSLRNVVKTGPYFHDGQVATLDDAVRKMAEFQLGKTLKDEEVRQIVAFLKVLTGHIDPEYIKPPVLPKSTATTPKPEPS
jgi:cytochrome c peroxidase